MRIARLLSVIMLSIGLVSTIVFTSNVVSRIGDYRLVGSLTELADTRMAWIGGTVELSLERSVTQVALSRETPVPSALRALIDEQRVLSDQAFDTAMQRAAALPGLKSANAFSQQSRLLRSEIAALRAEVDAMLSVPADQRDAKRAHDVAFDLKSRISALKTLSGLLQIKNTLTSSQGIALGVIQDRAWEVREYGGRARTYYAIATLGGQGFSQEAQTEVSLASKRAKNAWQSISQLALTAELPQDLNDRISAAEVAYFEDYLQLISRLDTSMDGQPADAQIGYPVSFDVFFAESNAALAHMSELSQAAGAALTLYWQDRQAAARNAVIFYTLVLAQLVAMLFIGQRLIRRRITKAVEETTRALTAVAAGDLDYPVETTPGEVAEITTLKVSLEDFKKQLSTSAETAQRRREEQKVQAALVDALSTGLGQISQGNLTYEITDDFGEGYKKLCVDFNKTCAQLRALVGAVVQSGKGINHSATEIGASSQDLAQRTESQAASLEETAAALDELTTSVKSAASGAGQADDRVKTTRSTAEKSGEVVAAAVNAMTEIKASSEEISSITGMINDIAFQTNLLALNAGVEAARAGDAGRGFAIVAAEVRALAQRAADAAKQISDLISSSTEQVDKGYSLVAQAGTSLTEIVDLVAEISTLVSDISNGSREQATTVEAISSAVSQLDRVTQQNAAMVLEVKDASQSMLSDVSELASLTGQFSLGQDGDSDASQAAFIRHSA